MQIAAAAAISPRKTMPKRVIEIPPVESGSTLFKARAGWRRTLEQRDAPPTGSASPHCILQIVDFVDAAVVPWFPERP
jgi:hypothetical protein